ncbi:hypothetical protein AAIB78_003575 [Morganella morganii]
MGKNNSGGYDGSNLGGHTTDHGNGWSTTSDNRGDIGHHTDNGSSKGEHGWSRGDGGSSSASSSSRNNDQKTLNYTDIPGTPVTVYAGGDTLSLGLGATLFALSQLQKEALMALLTNVTVISGRVFGLLGLFYPSRIAPDPKVHIHVKDFDIDNPHVLVTLPAEQMTRVPVENIPEHTSIPAGIIAQAVIDDLAKTRPVVFTPVKSTPVPVVRAQKTDKPNVYTAQVIPGMKPLRITVDNSKQVKPAAAQMGSLPVSKQYLSAPEEKDNISHHAVIDFGSDHAPLYISVTKQVTPEEATKQAEKARDAWVADNPAGVSRFLAEINTLIAEKEKLLAERQQVLKSKQALLDKYNRASPFENSGQKYSEKKGPLKAEIDQITAEVSSLQKELEDATGNKALNEKTLAEMKALEQALNQIKIPEEARKLLAVAEKELAVAGAVATEKEKQLANKRRVLKITQAEFQAFLDKYKRAGPFARSGMRFSEKEREFNAVSNQLSTEIGQLEKDLSDAMESRKKAEGKKKAAEDKVKAEQDKKRQGVKDKGHSYHEPPKTQDIKGLGELKESKPKTPKQGGAGKRARWVGDKGRKIYEWDYQHGEIEGYRASDGQHLGAFDPKTGNQLKPADSKRNIKKYL